MRKTLKSVNIIREFAACSKNTPFLLAVFGQFMFGFLYYGRNATFMYYYTYVEKNVMLMSIFALITLFPYLAGNLSFPALYKKMKNKGKVTAVAFFGAAASLLLLYFFRAETAMIPFTILQCISSYCFGLICTGCFAVIPDGVEYGELKSGVRNDAFQYSMASLGNKVGMAVSTAGFVALLGVFGYVENQEQTAAVLQFVIQGFTVLPGVLCILGGVVMMRYKITMDSFADIVKQLKERREQEG